MMLSQDLALTLEPAIGKGGIPQAALDKAIAGRRMASAGN